MKLAFQLRAVETMWLLAWEDVIFSDERLHVPLDLCGDPEVGAEKRGLDAPQVPWRAMMKSRLLKRTRAPGTQSPTW